MKKRLMPLAAGLLLCPIADHAAFGRNEARSQGGAALSLSPIAGKTFELNLRAPSLSVASPDPSFAQALPATVPTQAVEISLPASAALTAAPGSTAAGGQRADAMPLKARDEKTPEEERQRLDMIFEHGRPVDGTRLTASGGTTYVLGYNGGAEHVLYHSSNANGRTIKQFWKISGKTIQLVEQRVWSRRSPKDDHGVMQVSRFEKGPSGKLRVSSKLIEWKPKYEGWGGRGVSGASDEGYLSYYPSKAAPLESHGSSFQSWIRPLSSTSDSTEDTYFEGKVVLRKQTSSRNDRYGYRSSSKVTDGDGAKVVDVSVLAPASQRGSVPARESRKGEY